MGAIAPGQDKFSVSRAPGTVGILSRAPRMRCVQNTRFGYIFNPWSDHGTVRRDNHKFEVGAGDAFVQPPGTAHQIHNTSETED